MLLYNEVKVAGLTFNVTPKDIETLLEGDVLDLTAEPNNSFDTNAIMVSKDGQKLGYIPKTHNLAVAIHLAAGAKVVGTIVRKQANFLLLISISLI